LDGASLRYFNVFGPRQNPHSQYAAVIPKFIAMMRSGERPVIYGDGEQTRDFTYIDNVVDANVGAALAEGTLGGATVNIGAGGAHSLNDLTARLNALLKTSLEPIYKDARPGDVRDSKADITRANTLFGYEPKIDFGEGLRRTVQSFVG
jgi:nucleoside-diphosphate-sugar epimerase